MLYILNTNSCNKKELNECLTNRYMLAYDKIKFAKFDK